MRNVKIYGFGAVLAGLCAVFALPVLVHAQSFRSGDNVTVAAGEVVDSTLFSAGRNVDIAGRVNGDVFCAGQTVNISGDVTGDVICAAQTITISGTVAGDIRVAGQTVTLNGHVDHNATVVAQTFTSSSNSTIGGDFSLGGQSATVGGKLGRDLAFGGSSLILNGSVGRKLTGEIEHLTVAKSAIIKEGGTYASKNNAAIANGAQVGDLRRTTPKAQAHESKNRGPNWGFRFYSFLALLLGACVLALVRPDMFQRVSQVAVDSPLKTVLTGLIASLVVPILLLVLLVTVVGIPLALFLGAVWLLMFLISGAFSGYYLGRLLLRGTKYTNALLYMLLGVAVLLILSYIPILNILSGLALVWFGLGMMVLYLYTHYTHPRYNVQEMTAHSTK